MFAQHEGVKRWHHASVERSPLHDTREQTGKGDANRGWRGAARPGSGEKGIGHKVWGLSTSLPGELRLAPHAPSPGWKALYVTIVIIIIIIIIIIITIIWGPRGDSTMPYIANGLPHGCLVSVRLGLPSLLLFFTQLCIFLPPVILLRVHKR